MVQRATGKVPPQLQNLPELPKTLAHVWYWYQELRGARLTFQEIHSWAALRGLQITGDEATALKYLDNIFQNLLHVGRH